MRTSLFLSLLALSLPLLAKDEPKTAVPTPPAELAQLDFFNGDWSCTGTAFASPMGPEHATTAKVHGARAIGGAWTHVTYDEDKTAANPAPYHAGVYMGYDAAKKSFVSFCADSFGGYCNQTSSGWSGDTMTFEGTATIEGKATPAKDVFARKSATELTHEGHFQGDDKKWTKADFETCKKAK